MSWNIRALAPTKERLAEDVQKFARDSQGNVPESFALFLAAEILKVETKEGVGVLLMTEGHVWDGIGRGTFEISTIKLVP